MPQKTNPTEPYTHNPQQTTINSYQQSPIYNPITRSTQAIEWVNQYIKDQIDDIHLSAAMPALADTKRLRRAIKALERYLTEAAIAAMHFDHTGTYHGPGYTATYHDGTDRTEWNHESLTNELTDVFLHKHQHQLNQETITTREAKRLITEAIQDVTQAARPEWRSRELRKRHINPDHFSTVTQGHPSLEIRGEATYSRPTPKPRNR